jgi:hypothetical protein
MIENNWGVFDDWQIGQEELSWAVFDGIHTSYQRLLNVNHTEYERLLTVWNQKLAYLGEDPSLINWNNFRPLRLSREEDWSDWLGFLIKESKTGFFANKLFGIKDFEQEDFAMPIEVLREVTDFSREYRADIIIQWKNNYYTHYEIKVGDPSLEKTFVAGQRFRETYKVTHENWTDFILLLPNQVNAWNKVVENDKTGIRIKYNTWIDISILLRKSLSASEPITWKVWAYSFIGIIEQKLLGLDNYWKMKDIPSTINLKIEILQKALEDEQRIK